jgi:hypothetical protein
VGADGQLLNALPSSDKASRAQEQWRKCFVSVSPSTGEVRYIVDEIRHLTRVCAVKAERARWTSRRRMCWLLARSAA